MTKLSLTLGLIFAVSAQLFALTHFQVNHIEQDKYLIDENHQHITIPVNFGESLLLNNEQLKTLDASLVYRIDLVYTEYKSSDSFNQETLNNHRVHELKRRVRDIDRDTPKWNFIAQTGAKDVATARKFFHGFVIYYRPTQINSADLKTTFEPYRNRLTKTYTLDNKKGGTFTHSSGSIITIPANAVTDKNGNLVNGNYDIHYAEYRNAADIALSGINMTYKTKLENHNFSSIGMYEIRGEQKGKPLELKKSITVDFNCTDIVEDASFYQLDDQTNEWELIRPIAKKEFGEKKENNVPQILEFAAVDNDMADFNIGWSSSIMDGMKFEINRSRSFPEECEVTLNPKAWKSFNKLRGEKNIDTLCQRIDEKSCKIYTKENYLKTLSMSIFTGKYLWEDNDQARGNFEGINIAQDGNWANSTLLAEGMNKGHSYPKLVKGLNTEDFGVYNCDQIYRLPNLQTIHPYYVDTETGREISDADVLCVMDLDYNGSFSFDPNYVTLNPAGKNALLLVTDSEKTYIILPEDFENLTLTDKKPEIRLRNVTAELKSSADLKKMLQL